MGSETGARWFVILVLYFGVMTFLVALIASAAGTSVTTTGDITLGEQCTGPRTIWEQGSTDPVDITGYTSFVQQKFNANLDCGKSIGIFDNETCSAIDGCTWEIDTHWFSPDTESCVGTINYSINNTNVLLGGTYSVDTDNNFITTCYYPTVLTNESLCNALSCSWVNVQGLEDLGLGEPKLSMLGSTWRNIKDMFLFKFEFGFDDSSANYILNFLVFWLPLLGLLLSLYVMVRS